MLVALLETFVKFVDTVPSINSHADPHLWNSRALRAEQSLARQENHQGGEKT